MGIERKRIFITAMILTIEDPIIPTVGLFLKEGSTFSSNTYIAT